ncbi:hypothetical protein [Nocardia sp. NBC_00403]|uniref:hypothetical protein n=1 Tax=Nocardia sp. NBC_00403 TaxID=2975990 RepID=UPI002E1A3D25
MTSIEDRDTRPGRAAGIPVNQRADLVAEIERLRAVIADRDRRIAGLSGELASMGRVVDDLLDRESMHVYDPDLERLATPAVMQRLGAPRARHIELPELSGPATMPGLDTAMGGGWEGFDR